MRNLLIKRLAPFIIALCFGISVSLVPNPILKEKIIPETKADLKNSILFVKRDEDTGTGTCFASRGNNAPASTAKLVNKDCPNLLNRRLMIIAKPRALYTEEATAAQTVGTVRLKVIFSAEGRVTKIKPVYGLPNGLTQQAVNVAREIKFEPEIRCGKANSVSKIIEYNFNIY